MLLAMILCLFVITSMAAADWGTGKKSTKETTDSGEEIQQTIDRIKKEYPEIDAYLAEAYGYAVFPKIKKAGLGIGGAQGYGSVFQGEKLVGSVRLRQLTLGFQGGLQAFSEMIFFKDEECFDKFKAGETELNAQASAVVMRKGVTGNTTYSDGLAVFTVTLKGLMYEATIGGQRLKYEPVK